MKTNRYSLLAACLCAVTSSALAQEEPVGPFPPTEWPASADPDATVHYTSVGDFLSPLGDNWLTGNMNILSGGDQNTTPITIGGFEGLKAVNSYLNTADFDYAEWADDEFIDILMQVYGDGSLFNAVGEPRNYNFLIGTLPSQAAVLGGQIPPEARNRKWNWVLFRIPNTTLPDGSRRVGTIPANAAGNTIAGGINGGTIRLEQVQNLIVRAIAFGEQGAFGEPEQVNLFAPGEECPPEPETNAAFVDIANQQSDHMELLNDKDQTVTIETNIGPDDDKRRAATVVGNYMNAGITDDYLGAACNDAKSVKICVEYYDDPAFAGYRFGPEAYATDDQGAIGFVPDTQWQTLTGTGRWERRSWTIPGVSLYGVNTAPLTAGPRLYFDVPGIYVSKISVGVIRTGSHPLAGQDPLPGCYEDLNFCDGTYGTLAEMDLQNGILDGLAPGSSGGDQEMIQEEAGPENDRRLAIRPAGEDGVGNFDHRFLNLAITDEKLGPSTQPGVLLSICMTYYDDPALAGATFRPEVYQSDRGGIIGLAFTPGDIAVQLQGTGTWRDAYFEVPQVKFLGVNQGPQAAARFVVSNVPDTDTPARIAFSRVRYGVIRPCGPEADVNPLEACKPVELTAITEEEGKVTIAWPAAASGFVLQENDDAADAAGWTDVSETPVEANGMLSITVTATGTRFFRLANEPEDQ